MSNSKDVFAWLVSHISLDEPPDEIKSIAYLLMDHEYGLSRSQILAGSPLAAADLTRLKQLVARINLGEPVQHILGEQHFYGRPFKVNQDVLIPRPETETVITCAVEYARHLNKQQLSILDIGTGSGCLAITLDLEIEQAQVVGTDISLLALDVAMANNLFHKASVRFIKNDILNDPLPEGPFDLIVSNPPYVTSKEKSDMKNNVLHFEPHTALFTPESDPLFFYRSILSKSVNQLCPGGMLIVEINEKYGGEIADLFLYHRFQKVEILVDLAGKDRVVRGIH